MQHNHWMQLHPVSRNIGPHFERIPCNAVFSYNVFISSMHYYDKSHCTSTKHKHQHHEYNGNEHWQINEFNNNSSSGSGSSSTKFNSACIARSTCICKRDFTDSKAELIAVCANTWRRWRCGLSCPIEFWTRRSDAIELWTRRSNAIELWTRQSNAIERWRSRARSNCINRAGHKIITQQTRVTKQATKNKIIRTIRVAAGPIYNGNWGGMPNQQGRKSTHAAYSIFNVHNAYRFSLVFCTHFKIYDVFMLWQNVHFETCRKSNIFSSSSSKGHNIYLQNKHEKNLTW